MGVDVEKFKCDQCSYETAKKYALKEHVKSIHEGLYKHCCSQCAYKTNRKLDFERHKKIVHDDDTTQKKIQCHLCTYESFYMQSIQTHLNEFHELGKRRKKT